MTTGTEALLDNTTVLQADQFPIKTVKLFQNSGSAEITRTFPLSFARTQDEPQVVQVVHLPSGIQSVDVSVTSTSGNVTILDHYHTSIPLPQNSSLSSQTLRELETERLQLEDEKRLRQQSFGFLTTYMDSLAQCKSQGQPEAAHMVKFFDEFVEIGVTRSGTIAELDAKLADIGNRILKETERLTTLASNLPVQVVAILSCDKETSVEGVKLTVTYVLKQVSWKPSYDLHVVMAGNTPSPTVTLDFRCAVRQWTGENWENVSLALTTADQVSQLIQLPEPKKINISLGQTTTYRGGSSFGQSTGTFGQSTFAQPTQYRQEVMERDRERERAPPTQSFAVQASMRNSSAAAPSPPPTRTRTQVAEEVPEVDTQSQTSQLVSHDSKDPITHVASGCIFIPSDHAAHHVLVASLTLQAEFTRVVVPSIDTCVYYTCEVKNTSEYVLLPGTVKTFLNDKHVSSTEIHTTEQPQVLECSLAIDTGVKTMHNRAPEALPSMTAFTGKATTTYTSATVLHNTHVERIRGVIVRSSIPLPADPRITIVLKEPAGLAEIDEGAVTVKEGCLARWTTASGRKGKQAGLFEWVCDVNPGTQVLKAVWEVCAPQDMNLLEQVRA